MPRTTSDPLSVQIGLRQPCARFRLSTAKSSDTHMTWLRVFSNCIETTRATALLRQPQGEIGPLPGDQWFSRLPSSDGGSFPLTRAS